MIRAGKPALVSAAEDIVRRALLDTCVALIPEDPLPALLVAIAETQAVPLEALIGWIHHRRRAQPCSGVAFRAWAGKYRATVDALDNIQAEPQICRQCLSHPAVARKGVLFCLGGKCPPQLPS